MTQTTITPDLLRNALSYVPADLPRDEWARVGMAIKSEYPDDTGLQLFSDWSAASGGGFDVGAVGSTWRSIKAGGGVGVSTLLYLAKQHGFKLPRQGQESKPVSDEERQRQEDERRQRQQAEDAAIQAAQEAATDDANALWASASETGSSAYLERKGVQGFGVRYGADGWLLIPVRDGDGRLWNVQRIAPEAPAGGGPSKLFLKGGRKSGLWHVVGSLNNVRTVLVAEGYATAASLHMATGLPVAVAFDAGNLLHVARALAQAHTGLAVLVCGDDDVETQARTGRNPGREKAEAAARQVHGLAVFPCDLPEGGNDFNDMHSALGLQAVAQCVQTALQAHWEHRGGIPQEMMSDERFPIESRQSGDEVTSGSAADVPSSGAAGVSGAGGGNGGGRGGKRKGPANDPDDAPGWDDPSRWMTAACGSMAAIRMATQPARCGCVRRCMWRL